MVLLGATDFFTVSLAGVFSGVIEGVTFLPPARRLAYGSAVAGLTSSGRGRIGRRTVPDMSDPVPAPVDDIADFVELPKAEGGLALEDAVEAFDAFLDVKDLLDCDFTGEYDA